MTYKMPMHPLTDPEGLSAAEASFHASGARAVSYYGFELWTDICNVFSPGTRFTPAEATTELMLMTHWARFKRRTIAQYVSATLLYVVNESRPDGDTPLMRDGKGYYLTTASKEI